MVMISRDVILHTAASKSILCIRQDRVSGIWITLKIDKFQQFFPFDLMGSSVTLKDVAKNLDFFDSDMSLPQQSLLS